MGIGLSSFVLFILQISMVTETQGNLSSISSSAILQMSSPVTPSAISGNVSSANESILSLPVSVQPTQSIQTPQISSVSASSERTFTMDLPKSILTSANNAPHNVEVTSVLPSSTQFPMYESVAEKSCDNYKWEKPQECTRQDCVQATLNITDEMMVCRNRGELKKSPGVDQDVMMILEIVQSLGFNVGQILMNDAMSNLHANEYSFYESENIAMAAGFLDFEKYNDSSSNGTYLTIPMNVVNISETVQLNTKDIHVNNSLYTWAKFTNLLTQIPSNKIKMDFELILESSVSELRVVEGQLYSTKKQPDMEVNSNIILFALEPKPLKLRHPILITLKHKMDEKKSDIKCAYWDEILKQWSTEGISVNNSNSTHTVCKSRFLGNFALVSKLPILQTHLFDNKMMVTVASVLGSLSTVALVACIAVIVLVGYYNTDRMKIYINLDIALIVGHLVFFIGLSASEDATFCSNIATILHFCEVAALSWMFMEAVYIYDSLNNIFNTNNINPFFFYLAFGWGLPAAFAGSCSGYPFGQPKSNEFCWLFVTDKDIWYFAAPTLILVLMNIGVRVMIYLGITTTYPDDPRREKVMYALQTAAILLPVFILTWVFGVLAVNASTTKAFHYLFIIFHTMQGLLIFVFHCAKNKEIWHFYKAKKEEEERKANAVLQFTYVP